MNAGMGLPAVFFKIRAYQSDVTFWKSKNWAMLASVNVLRAWILWQSVQYDSFPIAHGRLKNVSIHFSKIP